MSRPVSFFPFKNNMLQTGRMPEGIRQPIPLQFAASTTKGNSNMTSQADRPAPSEPVQDGTLVYSGQVCHRNLPGFRPKTVDGAYPCFASTAPVAVPDGSRPMGEIAIGDQVLVATRSGASWEWSAREVQFSAGSPPNATGIGNVMFYIEYGGSKPGERRKTLVASPNQLFLLADGGLLKRADQLVPGADCLMDPHGEALPVARVHSGTYLGAVHYIAAAVPSYEEFSGSLDNHLIIANGVVSGDFALQRYQETEKMRRHLAPAAENPVVGTAAYRSRHTLAHHTLAHHSPFGAAVDADAGPVVHPEFVPDAESASIIPLRAATLFTPRQEAQLLDPDMPRRPMSDATNRWMATYYSRLYATFCPGVRFYIDWTSHRPNVFAFTEYGQKTVVVGGGLLRLGALYDSAMALVLAFGAATLAEQGESRPANGVPGTGRALYEGIVVVAGSALQGGNAWKDTMLTGTRQLGEVIQALIGKQDKHADAESLHCMLDVMQAAVNGADLPRCAGGPTPGGLQVVSASYDSASKQLTISFSEALNQHCAASPKNYRIDGGAPVTAVQHHARRPAAITLCVDLTPGEYTIDVFNVRAADGSTLDPLACSAPVDVS
jgi:hypothetical protein